MVEIIHDSLYYHSDNKRERERKKEEAEEDVQVHSVRREERRAFFFFFFFFSRGRGADDFSVGIIIVIDINFIVVFKTEESCAVRLPLARARGGLLPLWRVRGDSCRVVSDDDDDDDEFFVFIFFLERWRNVLNDEDEKR